MMMLRRSHTIFCSHKTTVHSWVYRGYKILGSVFNIFRWKIKWIWWKLEIECTIHVILNSILIKPCYIMSKERRKFHHYKYFTIWGKNISLPCFGSKRLSNHHKKWAGEKLNSSCLHSTYAPRCSTTAPIVDLVIIFYKNLAR